MIPSTTSSSSGVSVPPPENKDPENRFSKVFTNTLEQNISDIVQKSEILNKSLSSNKASLEQNQKKRKNFGFFKKYFTDRKEYKNLKNTIYKETKNIEQLTNQLNQLSAYTKENFTKILNKMQDSIPNNITVEIGNLPTQPMNKLTHQLEEIGTSEQSFIKSAKMSYILLREFVLNNYKEPRPDDNDPGGVKPPGQITPNYRMNPLQKLNNADKKLIKDYIDTYQKHQENLESFSIKIMDITSNTELSANQKLTELSKLYVSNDFVKYEEALCALSRFKEKFDSSNLKTLFHHTQFDNVIYMQKMTRISLAMKDIVKTILDNSPTTDEQPVLQHVLERIRNMTQIINLAH